MFTRGEKDRRRWNRERHPQPSPPPQSPHLRAHPQPQKGASSASQQSATELVVPPKKPRLAREPPPDPTTSSQSRDRFQTRSHPIQPLLDIRSHASHLSQHLLGDLIGLSRDRPALLFLEITPLPGILAPHTTVTVLSPDTKHLGPSLRTLIPGGIVYLLKKLARATIKRYQLTSR